VVGATIFRDSQFFVVGIRGRIFSQGLLLQQIVSRNPIGTTNANLPAEENKRGQASREETDAA